MQVLVEETGEEEPGCRVEGDARLPDVLLGDEGADGGRYGGRKVGDLAVGVRRLLKVFGGNT